MNKYLFNYFHKKVELKGTFMPKITRKAKAQKFNDKLSHNLTKHLFNFLSYRELCEIGKINIYCMNNIIDYINKENFWPEKVRKFKSKYNLEIYQNEVDLSLELAKIKKRRYKFPSNNGKKINYYQFDIDGNKYISIARSFDWAYKDNNRYWREEKIEGSYESNQKVPYLISSLWINTNFSFFHVKQNNYKVYINETFISYKKFIEKVILRITIDKDIIIYKQKFPNKKIFVNNSSESEKAELKEDFICYIKKEDFNMAKKDEKGDYIVKIEFNQGNNGSWKDGWFIDGGCLQEITQDEIDKEMGEMELMNKIIEEE